MQPSRLFERGIGHLPLNRDTDGNASVSGLAD